MTLKAAVIGVGSMGRNHVRVYADMDNIDLVAIADTENPIMHKTARTYRVNTYTDYRNMLDKERPDIVSITVPTKYHSEIACETIKHGVHVLVEKPLAQNQVDGRKIIDLAEKHKVKLMVGHIERFNPAIVEIKKRLDVQELGKIFQVHARRLSPYPGRIRDVGVVLDLATHDIDVMCYLIDAKVERVYAEIEHRTNDSCEDILSGLLRFSSGVIGVLDVNWLTPTKIRQLTVVGERGMYLANYLTQDVYWYKNSYDADTWETIGLFKGVREGDMVKVNIQKKEPLRVELEAFIEAVLKDQEPRVTGNDGLRTLYLAQKLIEAGKSHMSIHINGE
jgi:predicted dehydrogenase